MNDMSDPAKTKPNFIIINLDDLGYADIEPFGSKLNRTPNLNRMAAEGMKLKSFYAAPVCSPSRASLMTGCYPKRVGIPAVLFPAQAIGLNSSEKTIATLLKDCGYTTMCVGKWHLGDQAEFMPIQHGFDYYYGVPYSNDMGPVEDGSRKGLPEDKAHPPIPVIRDEQVIERFRAKDQAESKAWKFIRKKRSPLFGSIRKILSFFISHRSRFMSLTTQERSFKGNRKTVNTEIGLKKSIGVSGVS
jgi:arylsulfatase A